MQRCIDPSRVLGSTLVLALVACGDAGSATTAGDTSTTTVTTTPPGTTADTPTTTGSGGQTTTTSSSGASDSDSDATTAAPTTSTATTNGLKLDVAAPDQGGSCATKCGNTDWSYVWIANSGEHTISKIDTRTMEEEGRYITRADQAGNPSRTSVSIDGKAVAVANRAGGITKIWARPEYCTDKNGNGTIETSQGKDNVLPFDQEECVAWFTAFPDATTQRPIAWTSGTYNEATCEFEDQKIWTAAANGTKGAVWPCDGAQGFFVYRLNGDTGEVEDTIHMPEITCGGTFGPYGGAVDSDNNFWMYIWSAGTLVHVDHETLEYYTINGGSYGITVDTKGRVWIDSGQRYDPVTMQWASQIGNQPGNGGSGVAVDLKGRVWKATTGGVGWVDSETMMVGDTVTLPNPGLARGVGIDVDGYIWAVILGGTQAFRIHPDTYEIATYDGLNAPYTYSDMAGGQINNVTCNPQG